ncbi:MAG: DUF1566 domain-containing protein, partial [Gammaproteobacteria bacterium]|nr:DUF1566 domain-containing protein [Gammaproteobacteria bacterium]
LDGSGNRTGESVTTQTTDNLGSYSLNTDWSGATEIEASGNFLDESSGNVTTTPLTLSAVVDLQMGDTTNINLFTHLHGTRTKNRMALFGITTASSLAATDLKNSYGLQLSNSTQPHQLDLTDGSDSTSKSDNALLLLYSGALVTGNQDGSGTLQQSVLNNLATDFGDNGAIDGVGNSAHLSTRTAARTTSIDTLRTNLHNNSAGAITDAPAEADLTVRPYALKAGFLNDTGITLCGDYAYGVTGSGNHHNNVDCTLATDVDGDPVPDGQDADYGRDKTANDNSDGHAGFSFTKLDSNGDPLTDQSVAYNVTPWSCVRDNVSGLIWEVKTDTAGRHNKDDTFNWYNSDTTTNGGNAGSADDDGNICFGYDVTEAASYCNSQAYTARVNSATLCGASDWRMPTREELRSIVAYDRTIPAIDTDYFPNTVANWFWSASPNAGISDSAWIVNFYYGNVNSANKSNGFRLRLVRAGQ